MRKQARFSPMANFDDSPLDHLWKEYGQVFRGWDDLTLARWMAQTLSQLEGQCWRMSHPLLGTYRLAAQQAHDRQIWFKRLVTFPPAYVESACCRAPLLPMLTRDVLDSGLVCPHCGETCLAFEELPEALQPSLQSWAESYQPHHAVAHWEDAQKGSARHYEQALEDAAQEAEKLLHQAGAQFAPALLEHFPAVIWEDQDECLEVRPEDI